MSIRLKPHKSKTCLLRLSKNDNLVLNVKSSLLNISKSALMRDGAMYYWPNNKEDNEQSYDADKLLKIYKQSNGNKQEIVQLIFEYLRRHGYPHRYLSKDQLIKGMKSISLLKSPLLDNNNLQINTAKLEIPNYFHQHMIKVRCLDRYISPQECFDDDIRLKDAINRWMELGNRPSFSGLRQILRTRDGVRSVTNFKPSIAKYIYDNYCPANGKALDPCAGYGGRLSGCIASNKNILYHGIDPHGDTSVGNMKMSAFYSSLYNHDIEQTKMWAFRFKFDLGCAEDVMQDLPDSNYDLVFSSPPYYNIEKYSKDPTQSYIRYPNYDLWCNKFLFALIKESYRICKTGSYVILNVKNYKKYPIANDTVEYCSSIGFNLVKTYYMRLTNSEYHRKEGQKKWHTEPIFVFKK